MTQTTIMNDEEDQQGCYVQVEGGVAWSLNVAPDRNLLPIAFSRAERHSMREAAKALKENATAAPAPSVLDEGEDHADNETVEQTMEQSCITTPDLLGSPMATVAAPPLSAERMIMNATTTRVLQPRRIQPPTRTTTDVVMDGEVVTVGLEVAADVAAQHVAAIIQEAEWQRFCFSRGG